ncbi:hypothetical protein ACFSC4_06685 [Deinococcus malanensis]|uniref:hypothetical protein n=1 Tax=Deinococcus malanensis TaxID=1706855 RepID=UPI003641F316
MYVSALTSDMPGLLDALNRARGHLQREIGAQVKMRRTPTLEFRALEDARL